MQKANNIKYNTKQLLGSYNTNRYAGSAVMHMKLQRTVPPDGLLWISTLCSVSNVHCDFHALTYQQLAKG
ncbi:hypothetical protein T4E_2721 [Trichinella pseudospiralis]|uniref:Uncharacterized protein n=1 Tax=Trichinella pseudospiralis TaxID=6337 RepID=A0A0V0YGE6_TRIPS|nr:hypothetical protein T4E_2721 [Trichinella pseudospiralis]